MSKFFIPEIDRRTLAIIKLVSEQADDIDLWRLPVDCAQAEALQAALRQLHRLIEDVKQ